jgi:hypothetical protein
MRACLLLLGALLLGGRAQAEPGDASGEGTEHGSGAAVVEPAPGGGEMVILGPESLYVIHAWLDEQGKVGAGCRRDAAARAEEGR